MNSLSKPFRATLIALLIAAMGWIAWVAWQVYPRPLATELAYAQPTARVAAVPHTVPAKARKGKLQPNWHELSPAEQNALMPLAEQWDRLSQRERKSLLASARRYAAMTKQQQERYSSRLLQWSKMTPAQRDLARKRYAAYSRSRREARLEVERMWKAEQARAPSVPMGASVPVGTAPPSGAQSSAVQPVSAPAVPAEVSNAAN